MTDNPENDVGAAPRVPRWVKVSGIVIGSVALLFVVLHLTGLGGNHGLGQHIHNTPSVGGR